MKFNPLISVIIPVYNVEKHLKKCLDSIVNQTYKNLEIILIDDGSKDGSADICREYAEKDDRIVFISRENRGVSATRNEGIDLAHGDYFSFIDSDDYLELDAYEYLINLINEHNVDAVNYEYFITFKDKENTHKINDKNYGLFDTIGAQHQLVYNVAFAWNKLFSKKIIDGLKFDETILRGEDSLFARFAFSKADKVWFDCRPLLHYVQSENSAVRGAFRPSQLTAVKLFDAYNELYINDFSYFLPKHIANMENLMMMIYYDMWADKKNYRKEQKNIFKTFKKYYKQALACSDISKKEIIKLKIFKISPFVYCLLHKLIFG